MSKTMWQWAKNLCEQIKDQPIRAVGINCTVFYLWLAMEWRGRETVNSKESSLTPHIHTHIYICNLLICRMRWWCTWNCANNLYAKPQLSRFYTNSSDLWSGVWMCVGLCVFCTMYSIKRALFMLYHNSINNTINSFVLLLWTLRISIFAVIIIHEYYVVFCRWLCCSMLNVGIVCHAKLSC